MRVFGTILFILWSFKVLAQDPSFTQFHQKNPYINPAYAGITGGEQLHTLVQHRAQWTQLPTPYTTSLFVSDWRICQKNLGIGIIALQDQEGEGLLTSTNISIPIAAHKFLGSLRRIGDFSASLALQPTFGSRRIDWNQFVFSDQLDPVLGNIYPTTAAQPNLQYNILGDMAFGGIITAKGNTQSNRHNFASIGYAQHHIGVLFNNDYESFYQTELESSKYPRKHSIHASYLHMLKAHRARGVFQYWNAYALYQTQTAKESAYLGQNVFRNINLGAAVASKQNFLLGMAYKQAWKYNNSLMQESIVWNILYKLTPRNSPYGLALSYSYDMTISSLGNSNSGGSHEIALNIYWGQIRCPKKRARGRGHWWSHVFDPGQRNRSSNREYCEPFPNLSEWERYVQ